jgi:hypothetical protein
MLRAPGARVTGVDIEASAIEASPAPSTPARSPPGSSSPVFRGICNAPSPLGLALALAAAAGAPVRVADDVMDRLAVPVEGDDLLTPFLGLEAAQPATRGEEEPQRSALPAVVVRIAADVKGEGAADFLIG